jgi:hypothetical protein
LRAKAEGKVTQEALPLPMGRPVKVGPERLYEYYLSKMDQEQQVHEHRDETAYQLGISVPTLERHERQLRTEGRAVRITKPNRRGSYILVLGGINSLSINTSEGTSSGDDGARRCEKGQHVGPMEPNVAGIEFCATCGEAPTALGLVYEGYDEYRRVRYHKLREEKVLWHVQHNGRPDVEDIHELYEIVRQDRTQEEQDKRYIEKLMALKDRSLKAKQRSAEERVTSADAEGKYGEAYVWSRMLWMINRELERRAPAMERLRVKELKRRKR